MRVPLTMLLAAASLVVLPGCAGGEQGEQGARTSTPSAAIPQAPVGIDPNDPAMVFSDDRPCTAPCVRQGVVYARVSSRFRPDAPKQPLALDLYRSKRTPKHRAPVVLLLHGGGFVEGDRTLMRHAAEQLAEAGFLVASAQYRLVPADRNPGSGIVADKDLAPAVLDAQRDAERALRWIRRHAQELGATRNRQRYAVGGFSAGAITALRVAIRSGDRRTPRKRRWRVGAAFAISGAECGPWAPRFPCKPAFDRKDPPIVMFHGKRDSVVPSAWAERTCAAAVLRGGGCTSYFYDRLDHIWDSGTVFGGSDRLTKDEPAVLPTVAAFLRHELR